MTAASAIETEPLEKEMVVATNRRARHFYQILETAEAGLVLVGSEVKSLRARQVSLADSYALFKNGEVYLLNMHISLYDKASLQNHDPLRDRKLLLHRRQINRFSGKVKERGFTLIPLRVYFKRGRAKVELGLVRGKKTPDKRETLARREAERTLQRIIKQRQKY